MTEPEAIIAVDFVGYCRLMGEDETRAAHEHRGAARMIACGEGG